MKAKATILVVDDDVNSIDILLTILESYNVSVAMDGPSTLEILAHERPDLILLDIVMPGMDGFEVCETIKSDPTLQEIPILFVTARTEEEHFEKAFSIGGSDYITKPFHPNELLARVQTHLKLKSVMEKLMYMEKHDPLTGIYNRRCFFEEAGKLFDACKREERLFVAMVFDLDHFRSVNATYGYETGDYVLTRFTETVSEQLDAHAVFGRLGGDEFAAVISDFDAEDAMQLAATIRERTGAMVPLNGNLVSYSFSIGVATPEPADTDIAMLLVRASDQLQCDTSMEKR